MPIPNASYVRGWFLQERHSLVKQIASGAMRNLVPNGCQAICMSFCSCFDTTNSPAKRLSTSPSIQATVLLHLLLLLLLPSGLLLLLLLLLLLQFQQEAVVQQFE
jgi:hypothetical protein